MILTALRKGSELSLREVNETDGFHSPAADGGMWFCADEDYQTAEHIYRLAMILTALRKGSELSLREVNEKRNGRIPFAGSRRRNAVLCR